MSRNSVIDMPGSALKQAAAGFEEARRQADARVDAAYAECAAIARAEGNEDIARKIEEAMNE